MKRKVSVKKLIIIVVAVLAAVIVVPVVGIGLIIGEVGRGCDAKMSTIDNKASEINQKLERLSIPVSNQSAKANGDCLTTSGIGFGFSVQKTYASPLEGKDDIINSLTSVGLPALDSAQEPEYIFAQDGAQAVEILQLRKLNSRIGWMDPIRIRLYLP